jgi:hypothetical protein
MAEWFNAVASRPLLCRHAVDGENTVTVHADRWDSAPNCCLEASTVVIRPVSHEDGQAANIKL